VTGATGYIGGSVFEALRRRGKYQLSVLVRGTDRVSKFESLGAKVVVGSLEDSEVLTKAAFESDIIFHCGDSELIPPAQAMLEGLKQRKQAKGTRGIYIQTSGTGLLLDRAKGEYAAEKIYSDMDLEEISKLPLDAVHRKLDIFISEYPQEDVVTALLYPCDIYGLGSGPFSKKAVVNIQLVRVALKYSQTYVYGKGKNVWCTVYMKDLEDAYLLLMDKLIEGKADHGKEGFYFAENGEVSMEEVTNRIARILKSKNRVADESVKPLTQDVMIGGFGADRDVELTWGGNSRAKGERLRKLGWKPSQSDCFHEFEAEIDHIIQTEFV